jgi:hemerythrin-like domain-containing protein
MRKSSNAKTPTDILEEEHHFIQKVVGAMAVLAERLEQGETVEAGKFEGVVDFMRTFADKCHHAKEETHLFTLLEKRGVPVRGCPIGILKAEHQRGRALVSTLASATETYAKDMTSSKKSLVETLKALTDLYPGHIWKEDYLLFPMTNKVLSAEDQNDLGEKFEMVEKTIGTDVHERFERFAEMLEQETQK